MRKRSVLDQKLMVALSQAKGYELAVSEICQCPSRGGLLKFSADAKEYKHDGACHRSKLCFMLVKDKHNLMITEGRVRIDRPKRRPPTLDRYLGK